MLLILFFSRSFFHPVYGRCALGRYLYEELGDPGAGELLRKVPPKRP